MERYGIVPTRRSNVCVPDSPRQNARLRALAEQLVNDAAIVDRLFRSWPDARTLTYSAHLISLRKAEPQGGPERVAQGL
jgi:hypothetical protein